ncbi:unnamed protein product, partial [Mesorhabditis spiculigera]
MVFVPIRLVGEAEDRVFQYVILERQISRVDLLKKIEHLTKIPADFQEIRFRGDRLPTSLHPLESINDFAELVVKHSELSWWPVYKTAVEIAINVKNSSPERMRNAEEAVRLHTRLMDKGFFDVYCSFAAFRMENHHKVVFLTDGSTTLMKEATVSHFRALHYKRGADDEWDFVCRFEARPSDLGGTRKNTLAYVQLYGEMEETKYNVKCHHFGSSSSTKGRVPDIKEIFCYKLLELINVGPHVQFIIPKKLPRTRGSLYIATKWCDNFVPISSIKEEDVSAEVLVQILLLGAFLFIDDLHSDNCGQWKGTKEAAIVDFMPTGFITYTNIKKALLNNYASEHWEPIHINALEKCNEESRLEMAKECLKKWDLLSKIDMANEQIRPEKLE